MTPLTLGYAFIGGLLPSFVWLYFLLKEDSRCPEPKPVIALAFIAGMMAVPFALPAEQFVHAHFGAQGLSYTVIGWATIEEVLKYAMAAGFILWRATVDESLDYVIYMITVALGFAAAENMLYLLVPLSQGQIGVTLFTGDLRFLGSTLLHVVASSAIGFSLAFSIHRPAVTRTLAAGIGLILAIVLHSAFNALIMQKGGSTTLYAFFFVWIAAVVFFAAFEVLKYVRYRNLAKNTC